MAGAPRGELRAGCERGATRMRLGPGCDQDVLGGHDRTRRPGCLEARLGPCDRVVWPDQGDYVLKAQFPIGPSALGEEWSELQRTAAKESAEVTLRPARPPGGKTPAGGGETPPAGGGETPPQEFELRIRAPTYPWARVWWLRVCDLATDSGADEDTPRHKLRE
eukprot:11228364-Lingulodinium_polyedra.AAC.1